MRFCFCLTPCRARRGLNVLLSGLAECVSAPVMTWRVFGNTGSGSQAASGASEGAVLYYLEKKTDKNIEKSLFR